MQSPPACLENTVVKFPPLSWHSVDFGMKGLVPPLFSLWFTSWEHPRSPRQRGREKVRGKHAGKCWLKDLWGVALPGKYLPCQHGDLGSDAQHTCTKPETYHMAAISVLGRQRRGISEACVASHSSQLWSSRFSERQPCLKK